MDGRGKLLLNWSRVSVIGAAESVVESLIPVLCRTRYVVLFKRPRAVRWLTGACWLARRTIIKETGPFDENLFMYGQEPDFCHRIRSAGWEIYFLRHICIVHCKGQSAKQVGSSIPQFLRSMAYVIKKRLGLSDITVRERLYDHR